MHWRFIVAVGLVIGLGAADGGAASGIPGKGHNPDAVTAVAQGQLGVANASWWGFDPEDSTAAIQAAIDSGADKVIVPFMGEPWIVRPIRMRSNLDLEFEPGVLVLAKKGEFMGRGDSLFAAFNEENIAVRGYGATLRMRKRDYQNPPYERAEWRMGIRFDGCTNVRIEGLRIESSGGDGIYIGTGTQPYCKDVVIRDVVCYDNHRQGISVIGAENLLIENSVFSNTWGTAPSAGIDLEPDSPNQRLVNCVIRSCLFENNAGHAILVYLKNLNRDSEPVSVRFENCHARMGFSAGLTPDDFSDISMQGWGGMTVGAAKDDNPGGLVEFVNCSTENTGKEGAKVFDVAADGVKVRFVNCSWKNPWVAAFRDYSGLRVPVLIELRRPSIVTSAGTIEFIDCHVYDWVNRPVVAFVEPMAGQYGVQDVTGTITLHSPAGAEAAVSLGPKTSAVTLNVTAATQEPAAARLPDADAE